MKRTTSNMLKKCNDNRGIAMISILIAVAFISIIGSTLLYITYTNFQMKVMNNQSKENFYETDGELVRATAALRDYSSDNTKALSMLPTPVTVDANGDGTYRYDLTTALQFEGFDTSNTGTNANGDTVVVYNDPVTGDEYQIIATGNATLQGKAGNPTVYTIHDFTVAQKSKNDGKRSGEYFNKVQTDIEIKVLKQTAGGSKGKGLGECSMLSDSTISVNSSWNNFSFLTLFGDAYYSSYYCGENGNTFGTFPGVGGSGTYSMPGEYNNPSKQKSKPALHLQRFAKINFEADYMAVYGDLVLDGNSCLNISKGNLTVYGDIYLLGNSTLICGGTIYQPSAILPGRTEKPCFRSGRDQVATTEYLKKHLYYPGGNLSSAPYIAQEVQDSSYTSICTLMALDDADSKNDGITKQIAVDVDYHDSTAGDKKVDILNNVSNIPAGTTNGKINASYYGKNCGVAFANAGAQVGNIDEYENYILFITNGDNAKNDPNNGWLRLNGSSVRTTLVSSSPINLDVQQGVYFSKMGSDIYDYLTIKKTDVDNPYYKESIHKFELGFSGKSKDGTNINSNMNNNNYYSAGDFLKDDTNPKIINLFTKGINGGSGVDTYINSVSFKGYIKDAD